MNFDEWLKSVSDEELKRTTSWNSVAEQVTREQNRRNEEKVRVWYKEHKGKFLKGKFDAFYVQDENHILQLYSGEEKYEYAYLRWNNPSNIPSDVHEVSIEDFRDFATEVWKKLRLPVLVSFDVDAFIDALRSQILSTLKDSLEQ
jgi:hypothetical protein